MAADTKKNAIEKRLDELTDIWNEFVQDPDAKALRWLVAADEARMIELFLEAQNEELSDIPDLFIRFEEPFENPAQYGFVLREALCAKYEEIKEGIGQEGIKADWQCPPPQPGDIPTLINCCDAFSTYYDQLLEYLVLVLTPARVVDVGRWEQWLLNLVRAELPSKIKLMVVDAKDAPALEKLAEFAPERVKSIPPNLDMPGALAELAQDAPGHGPGHTFRRLFVALTNAAGAGDLQKSQKAADAALAIAGREQWPQQQVVIHMALGGAFIGAGQFEDALANYRQAEQIAAASEEAGDPAAPKLVMQTKMAQASALIGQAHYTDAAAVYESAAMLAENIQDHFMALENWRMAAYCQETEGQFKPSWNSGQLAIMAAEKLDEDQRVNSTLPYVGQGMLRIADKREDGQGAKMIEQRMLELIGPDWQAKLETGEEVSS